MKVYELIEFEESGLSCRDSTRGLFFKKEDADAEAARLYPKDYDRKHCTKVIERDVI